VHRLESWLARYWPELPTAIELTSSSLMALLARVGGPADVAAHPEVATKLLLGISHRLVADDKVAAVIASAASSVGVPLAWIPTDVAPPSAVIYREGEFSVGDSPGVIPAA